MTFSLTMGDLICWNPRVVFQCCFSLQLRYSSQIKYSLISSMFSVEVKMQMLRKYCQLPTAIAGTLPSTAKLTLGAMLFQRWAESGGRGTPGANLMLQVSRLVCIYWVCCLLVSPSSTTTLRLVLVSCGRIDGSNGLDEHLLWPCRHLHIRPSLGLESPRRSWLPKALLLQQRWRKRELLRWW